MIVCDGNNNNFMFSLSFYLDICNFKHQKDIKIYIVT